MNDTPTLFGKVPTTKRKPTGGITGHEKPHEGATNIWLTPKYIIDDLGPFDLDPCACETRWFDCARVNLTEREDGLATEWSEVGGGMVWLNPPYGPHLGKWFRKLIPHGNGISLTFARTETKAIQYALSHCDAVLFPKFRLSFYRPTGEQGNASGAPSMFIAFGPEAVKRLERSTLDGVLFYPRRNA